MKKHEHKHRNSSSPLGKGCICRWNRTTYVVEVYYLVWSHYWIYVMGQYM